MYVSEGGLSCLVMTVPRRLVTAPVTVCTRQYVTLDNGQYGTLGNMDDPVIAGGVSSHLCLISQQTCYILMVVLLHHDGCLISYQTCYILMVVLFWR